VAFELARFALDFLLLQLDLLLLLDDLHLDFLAFTSWPVLNSANHTRGRPAPFARSPSPGIARRWIDIALRLGDFRVGQELRLLPGLIRLRGTDDGIAISFGLRDDGVRV